MNRRDVRGGRRAAILGAALVAFAVVALSGATAARAQTGGVSGTTSGSLSTSDFFIGIQKVNGVNLSDVDKARFLNHASCQCKRDVWIKAILVNAASAAKAQTIAATDVVTMMLGLSCDNSLYRGQCLTLAQLPLSEFRLNGILAHTTVDQLAKSYGATVTTSVVSSGGVTGTDTGSGGNSGTGGTTVTTGTEITTTTDPCAVGDAFSQPVYIFVESSPGMADGGSAQSNIVIDGTPPPAPSPVTVTGDNEALTVGWTSVNNDNSVPDLQGYQVFCSRADQYQVFTDGTFSTSVDSCPVTDGVTPTDGGTGLTAFPVDNDPMALINGNTHYICSDFVSTSTTSHRVQILQNDVLYGIAVASVDAHGNYSMAFPVPAYTAPVQTLDFYHEYRAGGQPQGHAVGGCTVAGRASGIEALSSLAGVVGLIGLVRKRRRGQRS